MKLTNKIKMKIARLAFDRVQLLSYLKSLKTSKKPKTGTNEYYLNKFVKWLENGGNLPFNVFKVGNKKLPFLTFSTLPVVNCPGALDCLIYCYSLKGWRYPAVFFGQLQNTLLMNDFSIIQNELKKVLKRSKFRNKTKIDFRLYVDGDFKNIDDLKKWMTLLKKYPVLNAYGYSKSLQLFKTLNDTGFKFPLNYVLNLSNGGKFDLLKPILQKLNFVRGNFTAIKGKVSEIRKQFNKKIFICPGDCGSCTSIGHACGNNEIFKNMEIVIPIH